MQRKHESGIEPFSDLDQPPLPVAPPPFVPPLWMVLAASVIIMAGMSFGRDVLLPLALSLLLSFLVAPLVARLSRLGFPRVLAALSAVILTVGIAFAIVTFMAMQVVELAAKLPTYQSNIEHKIESLRVQPDGTVDRVLRMIYRIDSKLKGSKETDTDAPDEESLQPAPASKEPPPTINPLEVLGTFLNSTLGPLTTAGMVTIFMFFILLEREDIRNRIIRLLGNRPGQMLSSTQALDDAANRVSRYLMMQLAVNVTYGIPIGIGLYVIGVPNAILWGVLAVVLRFVPYVGPIVAAASPIALAFAVDPGWSMIVWTVLLYVIVELISNNFVETMAYGTSTGISSVGILLSAVFWGWLWGPIGLLMATPMTVCLVVLGRHIPTLSFFPLLLSDQSALPLHGVIYQRLLAMDSDEPDELVQKYLTSHRLEEFYDSVMLPLLAMVEEEQAHRPLAPSHRAFIMEEVRNLMADAADHADPNGGSTATCHDSKVPNILTTKSKWEPATAADLPSLVLCVPAHDETDELVACMLSILLQQQGTTAITLSSRMLSSERLDRIDALNPRVVCISALPPYAAFHARHSINRIRQRFPHLRIVVGFWGLTPPPTELESRLKHAGAQVVVRTLSKAIEELGLRNNTPAVNPAAADELKPS